MPDLRDNQDYTSIINDKQYNRLQGYLDNAREQGAQLIEINPQNELLDDVRKVAPTVLTGVTTEMRIMKEEIFGPLLPIMEYEQIDDVIEFINSRIRVHLHYTTSTLIRRVPTMSHSVPVGISGQNMVLTHVAAG
ncbi:aldehyde dehydrogenase family protein [Acinetobacter indicus]